MNIDWSAFDGLDEYTCFCATCDTVYRSHAKTVRREDGGYVLIARKPCPECKGDRLRKASSDPETYRIG